MPTVFRHYGDWNSESQRHPGLRFVEAYSTEVSDDLSLPYSPTKYYAPNARFNDTSGVSYVGAVGIRSWMLDLFAPFDRIQFTALQCISIDDSEEAGFPKYTVVGEFQGHHWFKGDPDPILVPRMMIFEIGVSATEDGFDGLQFHNVNLYWNTGLMKSELERRKRRGLEKNA